MPVAFRFRGVTTKHLYSFMSNPLPVGAATVVINGEVCVPTNNDTSLARGTRGPVPLTDPYGFTIVPSTWEQQ